MNLLQKQRMQWPEMTPRLCITSHVNWQAEKPIHYIKVYNMNKDL